jgi:prolyl-tRNA synthetase
VIYLVIALALAALVMSTLAVGPYLRLQREEILRERKDLQDRADALQREQRILRRRIKRLLTEPKRAKIIEPEEDSEAKTHRILADERERALELATERYLKEARQEGDTLLTPDQARERVEVLFARADVWGAG